jgi:NADH-quinone oxidoreductase subunit L
MLLMGVSVAVAVLGWWLAYLLYYKRTELPQKIADALGGFYRTVVHKYYVDEIYAALFVKPLIEGSTRILWQDVDRKIIDAAVNDAGDGARQVSDEARHMQSGNIRSYAGWIAAGSAVVIAFMIWTWMGAR